MSATMDDALLLPSFENGTDTEVHIELRQRGEESPLLEKSTDDDGPDDEPTSMRMRRARVDQVDENDEDPLLEVMDRIEDEVDAAAYDDLVPLHVKLALEENVFGWSHLFSDICGHIMFTAGYYLVAYFIVTRVCWKHSGDEWVLRWGMSEELFRFLRFILSFMAGVSGFRTVRRRRRVWLRAPYGTRAYTLDEERRKLSVRESDRTTVLGRVRNKRDGWLERRVEKKLRKASRRFEKRISKRSGRLLHVKHPLTDADDASPNRARVLSDGDKQLSPSRTSPSRRLFPTENDYAEFGIGLGDRRLSGHTEPIDAIESIAHDQILFSTGPIRNMPYSHGGFFGAAPFMLANPYWVDILRHLMPDVYVEISHRVAHAPASKLIHWAENNPVVAAYAAAHEIEYTGKVPNIEWDVFLDPHLVQRVEVVLDERDKFLKSHADSELHDDQTAVAMTPSQRTILKYYDVEIHRRTQVLLDEMLIAHGNLTQLVLEQTGFAKKYNFSRVKRTRRTLGGGMFVRQWLAVYAEAVKMGVCDDESVDSILSGDSSASTSPYTSEDETEMETESRKTASDMQSSGCGSSEGVPSNSQNRKLRRSESDYLPTRRRAHFAGLEHSHSSVTAEKRRKHYTRKPTTSLNALAWSKCPNTSLAQSISMLKSIMQCDAPIGLVLDLKSRHVPKRVWALVVDALRDAGARVEGVATFVIDEVRGISDHCTSPVKEVMFFHSAGDMQLACHEGRVQHGDTVYFNGGSLLWEGPAFSDAACLSCIVQKRCFSRFDPVAAKRSYELLPCARITPRKDGDKRRATKKPVNRASSFELQQEIDGKMSAHGNDTLLSKSLVDSGGGATIQQYKEKYGLSIGIYVQEFSIDEAAVNMLVQLVNENPHIYDLGFSWGGVNGITVKDIQPGRFTNTDGFWNQRYAGYSWDPSLFPPGHNDQ